jgi:hypothetical protein
VAIQPMGRPSPPRIDRLSGAYPGLAGQNPFTQGTSAPPGRPARADQLTISPGAQALNRLTRMWGALSWLFGVGRSGTGAQPWSDLSGLREALQQARQNAQIAQERTGVLSTLKTSVLRNAEALVEKYYGLQGDGSPLRIQFEADMGNALASVSFDYDRRGRMTNQVLHLNMSQLTPDTGSNGVNDHVIENDRIIAHELTHAIMGRNMDMRALPDWFAEGTAEYIAGAAERVSIVLQRRSAPVMLGTLLQPWKGDTVNYAAGYLAVRYLDQATADGGGIKGIMARLKAGDSLDQAIVQGSGGRYRSADDFLAAFVTEGEGVAFLQTIDLSGKDAGSIRPGAGPAVVGDRGAPANQPLEGFRVVWPSPLDGLPVGAPLSGFGFGSGLGFAPVPAVVAAYQRQVDQPVNRE